MFSLNYVEVFVLHSIVLIFGLNTKKLHFLSFVLHIIMCIVKYLVSSDEAVPAKCLCWIIFLILKHLWESQSLPLLHAWQIPKTLLSVQSKDHGLLETLFGKSGQTNCTSKSRLFHFFLFFLFNYFTNNYVDLQCMLYNVFI